MQHLIDWFNNIDWDTTVTVFLGIPVLFVMILLFCGWAANSRGAI